MTVVRTAGGIKQGYWFGTEETIIFSVLMSGWDTANVGEADTNGQVDLDSVTGRLITGLSEIGTVVYMDLLYDAEMILIMENFKFPIETNGTMSAATKTAITDHIDPLLGAGNSIDISSDTGAWYSTARTVSGNISTLYGSGIIADVSSHR